MEDDSEDVFEVEKIISNVVVKGKTYYRVRWKNYDEDGDTWEPEENLLSCEDLVNNYIRTQSEKNCGLELPHDVFTAGTGSGSDSDTRETTTSSRKKKKQLQKKDTKRMETRKKAGRPKQLQSDSSSEESSSEEEPQVKDPFWEDLQRGKIDVFASDLYSKVKQRRFPEKEGQDPAAAKDKPEKPGPKKGWKKKTTETEMERKSEENTEKSKSSKAETQAEKSEKTKTKEPEKAEKKNRGRKGGKQSEISQEKSKDEDTEVASDGESGTPTETNPVLQYLEKEIQNKKEKKAKAKEEKMKKKETKTGDPPPRKKITRSSFDPSIDKLVEVSNSKPRTQESTLAPPVPTTKTISTPNLVLEKIELSPTEGEVGDPQKREETPKNTPRQEETAKKSTKLRSSPERSSSREKTEKLKEREKKKGMEELKKGKEGVREKTEETKKGMEETKKRTEGTKENVGEKTEEMEKEFKKKTEKRSERKEERIEEKKERSEEKKRGIEEKREKSEEKKLKRDKEQRKNLEEKSESNDKITSEKNNGTEPEPVSREEVKKTKVTETKSTERPIKEIEKLSVPDAFTAQLQEVDVTVMDYMIKKKERKKQKTPRKSPSVERDKLSSSPQRSVSSVFEKFSQGMTSSFNSSPSESGLSPLDAAVQDAHSKLGLAPPTMPVVTEKLHPKSCPPFMAEFLKIKVNFELDEISVSDIERHHESGDPPCRLEREVPNSEFRQHIKTNNFEMVYEILKSNNLYNIEHAESSWMTQLMIAAAAGSAEIVKILAHCGARVNAKTKSSQTALMFAAEKGHDIVCRILIAYGAYVNLQTSSGETALMKAVKNNRGVIVRCLLQAGADMSKKTSHGTTVQQASERYASPHITEMLRVHEANIATVVKDCISRECRNLGIKTIGLPVLATKIYNVKETSLISINFNCVLQNVPTNQGLLLFVVHGQIGSGLSIKCRMRGLCYVNAVTMNNYVMEPMMPGKQTSDGNNYFITNLVWKPGQNTLRLFMSQDAHSNEKVFITIFSCGLVD